jgi:hypothetical protein
MGKMGLIAKECRVSLGDNENVLQLIGEMDTRFCEHAEKLLKCML